MSLSPYMNRLSVIYGLGWVKIGLSWGFACEWLIGVGWGFGLVLGSGYWRGLLKGWKIKVVRSWFGLGFSVGLGLVLVLGRVSGSSLNTMGECRNISDVCVNARAGLLDAESMFEALYSIGIVCAGFDYTVQMTCATPQQGLAAASDSSLVDTDETLVNTPIYAIGYIGAYIHFILPKYTRAQAQDALELLRTIVVIRCSACRVIYSLGNPDCYQLNMQILSRVVNMFDCDRLRISLAEDQQGLVYGLGLDEKKCRDEAQNTVLHAIYSSKYQLELITTKSMTLWELVNSGIAFARPFSCIIFQEWEFQDAHFIRRLPLINGYTLFFVNLPKVTNIDLWVLQMPVPRCHKIHIVSSAATEVTLRGLENVDAIHPGIVLEASWETILHLCKHNRSPIKVHTLLGLDISYESVYLLRQTCCLQPHKLCVFATLVICQILPNMPCRTKSAYSLLYTRKAIARHGISAKELWVQYKDKRDDLYNSISTLRFIGAISRIPSQVWSRDVICCGNILNDPDWMLRRPVLIELCHIDFDYWITNHKNYYGVSFCQNIRYTIIEINGSQLPGPLAIQRYAETVSIFRNITAQELRIVNIGDNNPNQESSEFNTDALDTECNRRPMAKLNLKVNTLVLDNIDLRILYWMLRVYNFINPIKLYIMNQRFKNMAIVQLLAHPIGQKIALLVINGFSELDEIKYFHQREKIEGFSLFRYIERENKLGVSPQYLGLSKLSLQTGALNYRAYATILRWFLNYGIKSQFILFQTYIARKPNTIPNLRNNNELTLYDIDLDSLKYDFISSQTTNPTRPTRNLNPSRPFQGSHSPKYSVKNLFLRFHKNQSLTEVDLVTIIHWVASQFKDTTTLHLANVNVSESEWTVITSRKYFIIELDRLKSIQIDGSIPNNPSSPSTMVLLQSFHRCLLKNLHNPKGEFTALASTMLYRLARRSDSVEGIIPNSISPKASFQNITKYIKENGTAIKCSTCRRDLYAPPKEAEEADVDDSTAPTPFSAFNPDDNFAAACYFECGHFVCSLCVIGFVKLDTCPICRRTRIIKNFHHLTSIPAANLPFAESIVAVSKAKIEWVKRQAWNDGYIYFYQAYAHLTTLLADLPKDTNPNPPQAIYLI
ncbi:hypothetical protein NEHOM01_0500 [Nematocida homosporus]|uniref:uncharacterized protein n=1 Tax=Nematocida homosporus TaxID=1912981 RepID=UPI00221FC17B|nr:uncharacterized protein NEHOM01_0500 [Nematocida homosporus]KAI5184949.1 hypothetical protein NEHOM01_0500 [Nematocida homosporus]